MPFTFPLIAFSFASCWFNPNMQGRGEVYLQGEWRQDSVPMENKLLEYSLYDIRFSCDSFYMRINTFSKVNNGADSCGASGHWTEYVRGNYQQQDDTVRLKGQFCNPDYSIKQEGGCFRAGPYEESFTVAKRSDSLIRFLPSESVIPVEVHLIKHTTCTPKPL